jgi:hypothetical protein
MNPRSYQSFPYRLPLQAAPLPPKWFIKNIGQRAVLDCRRISWGKIEVADYTQIVDGDLLTIPVLGYPTGYAVFEFDVTGTHVPSPGNHEVSIAGLGSNAAVGDVIVAAIVSACADALSHKYLRVEQPTQPMIYLEAWDGGARTDRNITITGNPAAITITDYSVPAATIHPRLARMGAGRRFRELHDPAEWLQPIT